MKKHQLNSSLKSNGFFRNNSNYFRRRFNSLFTFFFCLQEMSQLGNAHNPAHAALLGSQNAVTCPLCHKLFLGGENLMEHMKHAHKDPNASGVASKYQFSDILLFIANDFVDGESRFLVIYRMIMMKSWWGGIVYRVLNRRWTMSLTDLYFLATGSYLAKRRTANHPCPICGKHYVNEGSLRKHLACHPETSQFSSSLRMWPCSVCQAVFTHESGEFLFLIFLLYREISFSAPRGFSVLYVRYQDSCGFLFLVFLISNFTLF